MDGGIKQNPAYGTARITHLQDKRRPSLAILGYVAPVLPLPDLDKCRAEGLLQGEEIFSVVIRMRQLRGFLLPLLEIRGNRVNTYV